jgi:multiple sugar transport system permease protein
VKRHRVTPGALARVAVIVAVLLWSVGPILLALVTSLSTQAEVNSVPPVWWPHKIVIASYKALLPFHVGGAGTASSVSSQFGQAFANSLLVTTITVALTLLVTLPAGFAFARMRVPAGRVLFAAIVATIILPVFTLVAPLFRLMTSLHLIDTTPGLVLVCTSAIAPLSIWLFFSYCKDVPIEPQEAALVDGCSWLQSLTLVVIPQLRSGIAAITAILFVASWGQFLIPLLFATSPDKKLVTVLITEFVGKYSTNYPLLAAAGVLTLIPPAIVALIADRHIRGMLTGST